MSEFEEKNSKLKKPPQSNSLWIVISYAIASLGAGALTQAFGVRAYDFYENEMLLSSNLIGLAWIIYGIWNAINDPILGYLVDNKTRFTKRWGKRFPWIIGSLVPFSLAFVLIFTPPDQSQMGLFIWFLFTICLFDTAFTIWGVAYAAVLPDKFRSNYERNKTVTLKFFFSMFGLALGLLLPPLFFDYGDPASFIVAAAIVSSVSFISMLIGIPGSKDTPEMIENAMHDIGKQERKQKLYEGFSSYLKQKNARVFFIANLSMQCFQVILLASVPYFVRSILKLGEENEILLLASTLGTVVISLPLWYKSMEKKGSKFTLIIGAIIIAIGLIPLNFTRDVYIAMIPMVIVGFGLGGALIANEVCATNVIDENTVKNKKRQEATFYGLNGLIIRISLVIQAVSFSTIHDLTGYIKGAVNQPGAAEVGILMHFSIIPMICIIIVAILIWIFYDLTPEKVAKDKDRIIELGL